MKVHGSSTELSPTLALHDRPVCRAAHEVPSTALGQFLAKRDVSCNEDPWPREDSCREWWPVSTAAPRTSPLVSFRQCTARSSWPARCHPAFAQGRQCRSGPAARAGGTTPGGFWVLSPAELLLLDTRHCLQFTLSVSAPVSRANISFSVPARQRGTDIKTNQKAPQKKPANPDGRLQELLLPGRRLGRGPREADTAGLSCGPGAVPPRGPPGAGRAPAPAGAPRPGQPPAPTQPCGTKHGVGGLCLALGVPPTRFLFFFFFPRGEWVLKIAPRSSSSGTGRGSGRLWQSGGELRLPFVLKRQ